MFVSAAVRPNPLSAMRNMQNRFRRSNLEPHCPRNDPKIGPRSSRWGAFCALFAQIPNLPTKAGLEG
eukprot:14274004-Alexandrium_andersonii.AAC.1